LERAAEVKKTAPNPRDRRKIMNNEEIKKRLALISAFTEDAQAGLEDMITPFLLFGFTIPAGTFISYALAQTRHTRLIWVPWVLIMTFCPVFLALHTKHTQKVKIKRATDGIFAALWTSINAGIVLSILLVFLEKLDFNVSFFTIGLCIALGHATASAMVQKKLCLFLRIEAMCWAICGTSCLFVRQFTAPLIIAAATFVLLALPAAAALTVVKRKKAVPADERSR